MKQPGINKPQRFKSIMKLIFLTEVIEIGCDDCFAQVDKYVDMLRAGADPGEVLPKVKEHLGRCQLCEEEFRALIAILEAQVDPVDQSRSSRSTHTTPPG